MRGILPDRILTRQEGRLQHPDEELAASRAAAADAVAALAGAHGRARAVRAREVTRLVDAHVAGRENHAHTLFPLMVFERWCEAHLRASSHFACRFFARFSHML